LPSFENVAPIQESPGSRCDVFPSAERISSVLPRLNRIHSPDGDQAGTRDVVSMPEAMTSGVAIPVVFTLFSE
jgi:hypothetical protein